MRTVRADGTEVEILVRLAFPLPLDTAAALMNAIGKATQRLGYTEVGILTDGPHAGDIAGVPPRPGE